MADLDGRTGIAALADYLQIERCAMSAEIGKLRKDGIIQCRKIHFTLL